MYGGIGTKIGDANLNYKYLDESNDIVEIQVPLNRYCGLLSKRFGMLVEMLKEDIEKNKELKKVMTQINSMIVQLNKNII